METTRKFDLEERLLQFSIRVINVVQGLPENKVCNHLGGQLLRSGTSTALNYGEAQASESRKDFVHKFRIILKELRETSICLTMLHRQSLLVDFALIDENKQLIAIFMRSIATAMKNTSVARDSNA